MNRLLLLALLSFPSISLFAQSANPAPGEPSTAAAAQESTGEKAPEKPVHAAKPRWKVSKAGAEQLRKDLQECAALPESQQKACRREVYAARNDNLYSVE